MFNWEYHAHNGSCTDKQELVLIVVRAKSNKEADLMAKSIAKRDHYHLVKVIQHD